MSSVPAALAECRAAIDAIDDRLVALLAERLAVVDTVVGIKTAHGIPALLPDRVEEVVARVSARAESLGIAPGLVEPLWRHIIQWTVDYEEARLG